MAKSKHKRQYQVRIMDGEFDKTMSEPFDTVGEAQMRLAEVRQEILETWAVPDPDAAYIFIINK